MIQIILFSSLVAHAWAQVTCAQAPTPNNEEYDVKSFTLKVGPRYEAICGDHVYVHYAPPSAGSTSGVLRIASDGYGPRFIISVNGPVQGGETPVRNNLFWINNGDDCKTNFPAFEPRSVYCYKA
ncbi:hypothetical protein CGMCC3_g2591 [Colletotrichum fructicola]|nr:uncharacterized protein CGMCC3_g2591 [Colletotrichum fructicola]KAE9581522.1 hypothetical protein CGMCC3_g2591 [Colletotrichum fructicola]